MINKLTRLVCADNSGAKKVMAIGFLKKVFPGRVGSIISTTAKDVAANSTQVQKGDVNMALVIRTRKEWKRYDGSHIRFSDNACILLGKDYKPLGTRVSGPVPLELRRTRYVKLLSLAPFVV